jgi:hypothetical protein
MKPVWPISIWQPQTRDGDTVWVRPPPAAFGDHYASRPELTRKRAELPLRVVLFGESVAAGYLYAPRLTPAGVLEAQLQAFGGSKNFEVIDLARTNETLAGLRATVRASLQINPDVLVLLIGNNWNLLETPTHSAYAADPLARQAFGTTLRDKGLGGVQQDAWQQLQDSASAVFEEIALIARTVGIPVLVVIPEVNLADWENRQPVAWLPGEGVARWHESYRAAVAALERGDSAAAFEAAENMLALDQGHCPTAWRLLARTRVALGDLAGAAAAARQEVDCTNYSSIAFLAAPQAGPRVQQWLRDQARRRRWTTVDLPGVFAEHSGSPLPGHRLFLDYCHLSAEGFAVAMAAVAAAVFDVSGMIEPPPTWQALLPQVPAPAVPAETEAVACLGAAIHGAHRLLTTGAKSAVIEFWCRAALAAAPGIEATLLDVVEARCAGDPAVLSAAVQRNADSPYRLLLQHGWRWAQLDADVIGAIRELLPAHAEAIDRLLIDAARLPLELAAPPWRWLWEPLERCFAEAIDSPEVTRPAFLRCLWPETSFVLISDGERELELQLTLRLPLLPFLATRAGRVAVLVGEQLIATVELGERWSKTSLRLPNSALRRGLNRLILRWPLPPAPAGDPLAAVAERLAQGYRADLHPVFGEVFSVSVSTAAA